jgi:hypothetical protein
MTTPASTAPFQVGMLVKARGREWVVLPSEDPEVPIVRPLTGSEREVCGIYRPLEGEQVEAASFPPLGTMALSASSMPAKRGRSGAARRSSRWPGNS